MERLEITMFGTFSIRTGDRVINEKSRRSRNLWTLLEYLIAHKGKEIPQSELIDLLYDESANPASALKTQLCRVREVLDELGEAVGKELIVSSSGGYAWNDKVDVHIDAEEFETLCKTAFKATEDFQTRLGLIWKAIDLYGGDFLPSQNTEQWAIPITSYYHSMYIKAVYLAMDLLFDNGNFHDVVTVCQKAELIDAYDETIYTMHVKALAELGDKKGARELYLHAIDLFYNKLGVNPSEDFLELYEDTVYACQDTVLDFNRIKELLEEDSDAVGAFFCEYEFFKHIYKLERRASQRNSKELHICVINVSDENGNQLSQKKLNTVMEKLIDCIKFSLRSSDVFSRVSLSQYAVLLSYTSAENGDMVMKRIVKRFKRDNPKLTVKLKYELEPVI